MRWLGGALAVLAVAAAPAQARPGCLGAAARDPVHPCVNPGLRLTARPSARAALLTPNAPCTPTRTLGDPRRRASGALTVCEFGPPAARARRTVALLGDSHAMAWRAAVTGALRRLHWHGIDLVRSHCAFSAAVKRLPRPDAVGCRRHNVRVVRWLTRHPEVTAVITMHESGGSPFHPIGGLSNFGTQVAGFATAWSALPPSVTRVYAVRDNPQLQDPAGTARCVRAALLIARPPGSACAQPRRRVLRRDPFAAAARRLRIPRYRVLDLTRFFCGRRRCFPVIGGVRVYKDEQHLSRAYSRTLGPYLARRLVASER